MMDIDKIMALLPHRYPFLMIDRVVELDPGVRAVAVKCVTVNEPQFQGHFPGNPIMPGVLLTEAFAQAAGLTLHVENFYGENNHHIIESSYKALARALRQAVTIDARAADSVPSTKGTLSDNK